MHLLSRYRWLLPQLLFTLAMIAGRVLYTQYLTFAFLSWNLLLAIVPLYFSSKLHTTSTRWKQWAFAMLWLAFFPNSIYIITDLVHLTPREGIPFWYDILLLFSAALNGVVIGFISLYNVEKWLRSFASRFITRLAVFATLFGCGFGIYLGRYQRWNSWDVVAQPMSLFSDIVQHIIHPLHYRQCWLLSIFFAWWLLVAYHFFRNMRSVR